MQAHLHTSFLTKHLLPFLPVNFNMLALTHLLHKTQPAFTLSPSPLSTVPPSHSGKPLL